MKKPFQFMQHLLWLYIAISLLLSFVVVPKLIGTYREFGGGESLPTGLLFIRMLKYPVDLAKIIDYLSH
jgi:hypothetical protein